MSKLYFSRKGLTLLFLLAITFSQSQTINTTYKTQINAKFAGLDKTKVPTKLLINQAMEFAELTDYSGAMSSTNFITKGKFTNIYNTLLMSRVNATVTGLINPNTFKTNWDNLRAPNKIVLSGLYYKYNKFKTNAYPNFLVNNNGVITDKYVNGVWQNPYIDQQVFAIAAPILIYKSLSLQVTLPASLWYANQASSVQSIAIDYGNGTGYQTMTLGQIHTVNYTASGTYEWKYKLTLTNNQVLYSHSKLKIDVPVFPTIPTNPTQAILSNKTLSASQAIVNSTSSSCTEIATIPFTGTRQYLGIANSATLQVRYRNSDCIISKPLIIVEGFDSGLLGVENPFGENDLFKFAQEAFDDTGNLQFEIINKDIIYINFNNGRDDLRRNAYLVEDIIKWVNTKKAQAGSTTPNAVIGQSMGGVIARYALRDMEILGQAHQTSLFVSHDAPQQGANIPVGVQYFARHLADQFIDTPVGDYQISLDGGSTISIADIQNLLNAQGTKQLLANSINSGFALDNTTFNAFQTELRNLGYPTQTRNIALSNGNHCANPQEFNPSAPLFNLYGNASATALTTFLTTLLQPLTNVAFSYLAYEFNEPGLLLGLLPGSSSFNMNFNAYALPSAGTNNQVYSGNISYTKKIFSLFGWNPQITVSLTNRSYNNPVALSYDYYPGGKYQLPFNFSTTTINNDFINLGISAYLAPSFNFIPVPSALDIGSGATILNDADYFKKYNAATPPPAPRSSPFANFTTSFPDGANINENHISFNTRNGNWLATELDSDTNNNAIFDCTLICSNSGITGNDAICDTGVFSVTSGANSYNWYLTEGANLVNLTGTSTNSVIINRVNASSNGYITLNVDCGSSSCGNITITKRILVGTISPGSISGTTAVCRLVSYIYTANVPGGHKAGYSYRWTLPNAQWQIFSQGVNTINAGPAGGAGTNTAGQMLVEANNGCGWSIVGGLIVYPNPSCSTGYTYRIYPNPVNESNLLTIQKVNDDQSNTITDTSTKESSSGLTDSVEVEIKDLTGNTRVPKKTLKNKSELDISGLNRGVYVLLIYDKDEVSSQKIIVN